MGATGYVSPVPIGAASTSSNPHDVALQRLKSAVQAVKVGSDLRGSPHYVLVKLAPCHVAHRQRKNGISSSRAITARLGVTQRPRVVMLHRHPPRALKRAPSRCLAQRVSLSRTGKPSSAASLRNMHAYKRQGKRIKSPGPAGKAVVLGILETGGQGPTYHVAGTSRRELFPRSTRTWSTEAILLHRLAPRVSASPAVLPTPVHRPRTHVRGGPGPHERPGELLEPVEAHPQGHVRVRGSPSTCSAISMSKRSATRAPRQGCGPVPHRFLWRRRSAFDVQ